MTHSNNSLNKSSENNIFKIYVNVIVKNSINENIIFEDIEDKYDEQTLEDWYDFASNIESYLERKFFIKKVCFKKNKELLQEKFDFCCKGVKGNQKEGLIGLRLLDLKSNSDYKILRQKIAKKNNLNSQLVFVVVNRKKFKKINYALEYIKVLLNNFNDFSQKNLLQQNEQQGSNLNASAIVKMKTKHQKQIEERFKKVLKQKKQIKIN